eukprot:TRINITY_DN7080_c0_g1_i2.p1 TRINITY_DN7080_c0_g1~~TRINITY_DN7080_c0_g1_i2.p1  ORF type:complete len:346 (-),score=58.87 TRINITY_DN7080_c0_g1_i2:73-1080(-)
MNPYLYPYYESIHLPPGLVKLPYKNRHVFVYLPAKSTSWRHQLSLAPPPATCLPGGQGPLRMEIQVQKAECLIATKENGGSDAFVSIASLNSERGAHKTEMYKSNVVPNTVFPVWSVSARTPTRTFATTRTPSNAAMMVSAEDNMSSTFTVNAMGRRNVYVYLASMRKNLFGSKVSVPMGVVVIDLETIQRAQERCQGAFIEDWFTVSNGGEKSLLVSGRVLLRLGLFTGQVNLGNCHQNAIPLHEIASNLRCGWWPTPAEVAKKAGKRNKAALKRLDKVNRKIEKSISKKKGVDTDEMEEMKEEKERLQLLTAELGERLDKMLQLSQSSMLFHC